MKKLFIIATFAVAFALVLNSCSSPMGSSSSSGITFTIPTSKLTMPTSSAARAISGNEVRLWLYDGTTLYPNGLKIYWSAPFTPGSNTSVTINGIPDGANYHIVVAVGTLSISLTSIDFSPTAFASSDRFSISSGATTNVSLTLKDISKNFVFASLPDAISVEELNGTLYAASNSLTGGTGTVFSCAVPLTTNSLANSGSTPGLIRSLSEGYSLASTGITPFLLVNTSQGVYQQNPGTPLALVAPVNNNLTQPDVTWSGAATWTTVTNGVTVPFSVYFYTSSSGASFSLGGLYDANELPTSSTSTAAWRTVNVSNLTGIIGNPILDFALTTTGSASSPTIYGFFATRLVGTVRVNSDWLQQTTLQLSDLLSNSSSYFTYIGAGMPLVQALGLAPDSVTGTQTLYLGTAGGVYTIPDATATTLATPVLVNGTQGIDIQRIVTDAAGDVAFYSPVDLFVLPVGKPLLRLPFVTSTVGIIHDVRWSPSTSGTLYIVGNRGVAQLAVGSLE